MKRGAGEFLSARSVGNPAGPSAAGPRPPLRVTRLQVAGLLLGVAGLCAFGFWGMWPWLVEAHRRLEPWKVVGIWIGDVSALVCALWVGVSFFLFGSRPLPEEVATRRHRSAVIALGVGILLDLGFSWYVHREDQVGYDTGASTTAEVRAVRRADAPYVLECHYTDDQGKAYQADVRTYEDKAREPPEGLGVAERKELRFKPLPFTIRIRYDRSWPRRCWVEGAGVRDASDLHTLSFLLMIFQVPLLLLLWAAPREPKLKGTFLARHELYRLFPLLVEAGVLAFFGLLAGLGRLASGS